MVLVNIWQTDRRFVQKDNCKLDYDWLRYIWLVYRKLQDMDRHIFVEYMLCLMDILN